MNTIVIRSIVRELNFCEYEISLLLLKSGTFDQYLVMRDLLETFTFMTSFVHFGSPIYNYLLHKIAFYLREVKKIKFSNKHASNIL